MSINDTLKSIHTLAVLRDDISYQDTTSIVITPVGANRPPSGAEVADAAETWTAQTYRGKARWGNIVGEGATPTEAIGSLLKGLLHAHHAVDERRSKAMKRAEDGASSTER